MRKKDNTVKWSFASGWIRHEQFLERQRKKRREQELEKKLEEAAEWLQRFLFSEEGKAGIELLGVANRMVVFASMYDFPTVHYCLNGLGCTKVVDVHPDAYSVKIPCLELVRVFHQTLILNSRRGIVKDDFLETLKVKVIGEIDQVAKTAKHRLPKSSHVDT